MQDTPPASDTPESPPPSPPSQQESANRTVMLILSYLGILALVPLLVEKDDPGRTLFLPSGGLLTVAGGEQDKRRRQASFEAGLKFNLQVRHLDADVYGNTAVLTYYRVGTITRPDGLSRPINFRVTVIRVKQAGQWKEVHRHGSNLTPP